MLQTDSGSGSQVLPLEAIDLVSDGEVQPSLPALPPGQPAHGAHPFRPAAPARKPYARGSAAGLDDTRQDDLVVRELESDVLAGSTASRYREAVSGGLDAARLGTSLLSPLPGRR